MQASSDLPILYSFRRCPYAMRARLAIVYAEQRVQLREILLRDKPAELLAISPKATVPVLQLPTGKVIDESWDIMQWALPADQWPVTEQARILIDNNDHQFKSALDAYKYPDRIQPALTVQQRFQKRAQCAEVCGELEHYLSVTQYLLADDLGIIDLALMPFIRQFSLVEPDWFAAQPWPNLLTWLQRLLQSDAFAHVMQKYPSWQPADQPVYFPA